MRSLSLLLLVACGGDPGELRQQVGYRDGGDGGANSGERGTVKVSEILWTGSVTNDGVWDKSDIFVELRNEGMRPMNLSGWQLEVSGDLTKTWLIPDSDTIIEVGEHLVIATKDTGCFPEVDYFLPDLELPYNAPFRITLVDADERLIEPAGSRDMPPFAGGYDGRVARSMEKIEIMFGGRGTEPHAWHYYTDAPVDVPNNDKIAAHCAEATLASPGRANSPDYSGAYASGSFE